MEKCLSVNVGENILMKKKVFLIILIILTIFILINIVNFSISCIKSDNMYENNIKIENQKMEMVKNDFNEMINCLTQYETIPSDIDIESIYIQNFENCSCSIKKPRTTLGSREVEKRNFLLGKIEYSIYIYSANLEFIVRYEYDFYSDIKKNYFAFVIDDSDTSYFEKNEFELFNDYFSVINDYFDWNFDFVDMLYTNQNIEFTGENFDLNKYKADERRVAVAYEYSFDIDVNNKLSIIYKAYQENGKSDYRKVFSITVYEKVGDA